MIIKYINRQLYITIQMASLNQLNNSAIMISKNRFNLALCEIHYTPIHGKTSNSCPDIEGHFLVIDTFDGTSGIIMNELDEYVEYDTDEEYNDTSSDDEYYGEGEGDNNDVVDDANTPTNIYHIQRLYRQEYAAIEDNARYSAHTKIRNYFNIISRPDYIKPEIAECFELPTFEYIAIIKTIWIKIIQRKWKKVFALRKIMLQHRSNPSTLYARQMTGKWPDHCLHMPGLKGMLSDLN